MSPLLRMTLLEEKTELDYVASAFPSDTDHEAILLVESAKSSEKRRKNISLTRQLVLKTVAQV